MIHLPLSQPPLGLPWEINRRSPQAVGLAGWWTFVDSQAPVDRAGSNIMGAGVNSPVYTPEAVMGAGYDLNGSTSYLDLGRPAATDITGPLTVSAWVRFDSTPSQYPIVCGRMHDSGGNRGYALIYYPVGAPGGAGVGLIIGRGGSSWYFGRVAPISVGVMTHYAATWNGTSTSKVYKNGIEITPEVVAGSSATISCPFNVLIGKHYTASGAGWAIDGVVADARIYNRALSAAEVWALYSPQSRWDLYGVRAPRGRGAAFFATMMQHHHAMLAGGRS